jgi:hypothetical protein
MLGDNIHSSLEHPPVMSGMITVYDIEAVETDF